MIPRYKVIKKRNIAVVMAAAMMCASAMPMLGEVTDGRNNLPTVFITGKVRFVLKVHFDA